MIVVTDDVHMSTMILIGMGEDDKFFYFTIQSVAI